MMPLLQVGRFTLLYDLLSHNDKKATEERERGLVHNNDWLSCGEERGPFCLPYCSRKLLRS